MEIVLNKKEEARIEVLKHKRYELKANNSVSNTYNSQIRRAAVVRITYLEP